jgi:ATP-binding cassette subfamily B protein
VIITHRMAAAMNADEIVVLDGGTVVEHGRHGPLLAAGGLYAEMCRIQGLEVPPDLDPRPRGRHAADPVLSPPAALGLDPDRPGGIS